jgi:hypothetical protein
MPPPLRQMKAPMRKRKLKRGGYGGWELRTFVLKDGMLIYFKDADAARCQVWEGGLGSAPRDSPAAAHHALPACLPATRRALPELRVRVMIMGSIIIRTD